MNYEEGVTDLATVYREMQNPQKVVIGLANFSNDDAESYSLIIPKIKDKKTVTVRMLCFGQSTKCVTARKHVHMNGTITLSGQFTIPSMEVGLVEIR